MLNPTDRESLAVAGEALANAIGRPRTSFSVGFGKNEWVVYAYNEDVAITTPEIWEGFPVRFILSGQPVAGPAYGN